MDDTDTAQVAAVREFRRLHDSGTFVVPNPWDAGSAVYLQHLGFQALATTSAGFAFSKAWPDEVWAVPRDAMLGHVREVVAATELPVSADFQSGYAHEPADVAANVTLCVATGVAGLSIEDATGDAGQPLYEAELAVERVRAARAAIDAGGVPVVLTARCEAALVGHPDPLRVALDRLSAYAEAGADCLYAPGLGAAREVTAIVSAVAPRPVNVLASSADALPVARLAELGVRRVSVGSALARAAWSGFIAAAREIAEEGTFTGLSSAASFAELNGTFQV